MELYNIIREMLTAQIPVSLPGIGKLWIERQPALLNKSTGILHAPSYKICFSANNETSNTIKDFIIKEYGIPANKAEQKIQSEINNLIQELDKNNIIKITGVGEIKKNNTGELSFIPESSGIYPYINQDIKIKTLEPEKNTEIKTFTSNTPENTTKTQYTPLQQKKEKNKKYIWLILVLLLLAGSGIFIFMPLTNTDNSEYETTSVITPPQNEAMQYNEIEEVDSHLYYLVAGSFTRSKNANLFAEKMKAAGYQATILKDSIFYRVVIMEFSNRDEALQKLNSLRNEKGNDFVWMLTKQQTY